MGNKGATVHAMNKLIILNFKLSIIVTLVGCAYIFSSLAAAFPESLAHLGAYRNQTLIWPIVIVFLTIMLWFAFYKNESGHFPAFIMGFTLLVPAFGASISETINGEFFSNNEEKFLYYIGISHILYGLQDWRKILVAMGQDAN